MDKYFIFQMGYTYVLEEVKSRKKRSLGQGGFGFAKVAAASVVATRFSKKYLEISDFDRSVFMGSFTIHVFFKWNGEEVLIGREYVLKRWDMSNCGNCQNRYLVNYKFPLINLPEEVTDIKEQIVVKFNHHNLEDMKFAKAPTLTVWSGNESNDQLLSYTLQE